MLQQMHKSKLVIFLLNDKNHPELVGYKNRELVPNFNIKKPMEVMKEVTVQRSDSSTTMV
jgi:hypothetical protein